MLVIHSKNEDQIPLKVKRFVYKSALSTCYELLVDVVDFNEQLQAHPLLFCKAVLLYVNSAAKECFVNGMISAVERRFDPLQQKTFYTLKIEPYLSKLSLARNLRVYQALSALDTAKIILQNLTEREMLSDYAEFNISMPYLTAPRQIYDIAFEDSELDYFNKILNYARYYFEQSSSSEKLIVVDAPELLALCNITFLFDPSRKEDIQNNAPNIYHLAKHQQTQALSARPIFFDPYNLEASLKYLRSGQALVYETAAYAPLDWQGFIQIKLNEQLSHDTEFYEFKSYYSGLAAGDRLFVQSAAGHGDLAGFIDSLCIEGYYQNDHWRFEVAGRIRPYAPGSAWLGAYQPRKLLPAALVGGMLQEAGQVNDFGEYQVKLPTGFNVGSDSPAIQAREIQETATQGGGASHAVSGKSHTVLLSQDGLPTALLLCGSLIDNQRASHITCESYREMGVKTQGGLKIHMQRSDESHAHSEMGTALQDSQGNAAHLTLGANAETLNKQGARAHGLMSQSTGYAKRVVAGNDYATVGQPENPVTQKTLISRQGMSVHSTQINVGKGSYTQTYHTDASGVKVNNADAKPASVSVNMNAIYYFYVADKAYQHICELADELYDSSLSAKNEAKFLFENHNLQIYGVDAITAGSWLFIPRINENYEIGNILKVMNILKLSHAEQEKLDKTAQNFYGQGVRLLGSSYFALEQAAEGVAAGFQLMDDNFNGIKQAAEDLASLGVQAKQAGLTGSISAVESIKTEIRLKTAELTKAIQTFIEKTGTPSAGEQQKIKADTTVEWQKNLLSLKELNLADSEIDGLNAMVIKGSKIASYSSILGKFLLALGGAQTSLKIYEACKANPESPLCYQAAAEDGGEFAGNVGGGYYAGDAAIDMLTETSGGAMVGEFLGCNMALDIETFGAGALVCTAAIFGASSAGSYYGGKIVRSLSTKLYEYSFKVNK